MLRMLSINTFGTVVEIFAKVFFYSRCMRYDLSASCFVGVQDKTFGIKNKKGSKQQKFIQTVQQQVTMGGKTAKQVVFVTF